MADTNVSILVTLKNAATEGLNKLSSNIEDIGKKATSLGKTLTLTVTTPLAAFSVLAVQGAADLESLGESFNRLTTQANIASDELLAKLIEVSQGTISNKDLILAANRAMSLGVAGDINTFTTLLEVARLKARDMGITTTQAFNDIVTGIGRGSPLILDNLGIIVAVGDANQAYADSLGKTVEQLTAAEQQQALLNAVLQAAQDDLSSLGGLQLTNSERFQQLTASIINLKDAIGKDLLPFALKLIDKATELILWFNKLDQTTKNWILTVGALTAIIGPLLIIIGFLIAAITAIGAPIAIISVAIVAFIGLLFYLKATWIDLKDSAKILWNDIKDAIIIAWDWLSNHIMDGIEVLRNAWNGFWDAAGNKVVDIWEGIKATIKASINYVISMLNTFISKVNGVISAAKKIPGVKAVPQIASIPMLAKGGTIQQEGKVIVGERGAEMLDLPKGAKVTPLDKTNNASNINIYISGNNILDKNDVIDKIGDPIITLLKQHFAVV